MAVSFAPGRAAARAAQRVFFLVEGFTDIRFVAGLSEICELTMVVPAVEYRASGLAQRLAELSLKLELIEIGGRRLAFQIGSLAWLMRHAARFDVILAQEALRGALNANLAGRLRRVPVVTYIGIAPVEYFRCRRERQQIGRIRALAGEAVIRTLLALNGRLAARTLAMGPYVRGVAERYSSRVGIGRYYGVDTARFRPADAGERTALRARLGLPHDRFMVLFASRISHEKDPETVIRAVASVRARGLNAVLINLGGGWQEFLALARRLCGPEVDEWAIGRPAVNPLTEVFDYFRCTDVVAQASLAEGAAFATLEALACATPVVATAVGGMAIQLDGLAQIVPRGDANAMAEAILWVAANCEAARAQAKLGRDYVNAEWNRDKAFADLRQVIEEVATSASRWLHSRQRSHA
ncbi:MAG TPA: glycosyltransferase [Candidatus Binataceae bacterium]|nr:glycosyltransferase [Candidatus Binataceae bacterium]